MYKEFLIPIVASVSTAIIIGIFNKFRKFIFVFFRKKKQEKIAKLQESNSKNITKEITKVLKEQEESPIVNNFNFYFTKSENDKEENFNFISDLLKKFKIEMQKEQNKLTKRENKVNNKKFVDELYNGKYKKCYNIIKRKKAKKKAKKSKL